MSGTGGAAIQQRVAAMKARLPMADVVGRHVKLSGSARSPNRRGPCPFHGGRSASFSIKGDHGHCYGCQWQGDVITFMQDHFGLSFGEALEDCERMAGLTPGGSRDRVAAPVQRARNPFQRKPVERILVEPIDMGRALWRRARPDARAVRRYFEGRGVPARILTDDRIAPFLYLDRCPCIRWDAGADPAGVPHAPAIMALVRRPEMMMSGGEFPPYLDFVPTGLHVTYLNPAGDGTMVRRKPWARADDPDPMLPKRRMLGPVRGGAILLGRYTPNAHLWIGEGNETVLSAMGLADAPDEAVGVATLSLDNLQGGMRMWKNRVWPLHAIAPAPDSMIFLIPGHDGPVTGLVDSDMSSLRGMRDPATGAFRGEAVVERKGGPIVHRAINGAERARICGELFVKSWRAAGADPVEALRAPAGMDFNDAAREAMAHG